MVQIKEENGKREVLLDNKVVDLTDETTYNEVIKQVDELKKTNIFGWLFSDAIDDVKNKVIEWHNDAVKALPEPEEKSEDCGYKNDPDALPQNPLKKLVKEECEEIDADAVYQIIYNYLDQEGIDEEDDDYEAIVDKLFDFAMYYNDHI